MSFLILEGNCDKNISFCLQLNFQEEQKLPVTLGPTEKGIKSKYDIVASPKSIFICLYNMTTIQRSI